MEMTKAYLTQRANEVRDAFISDQRDPAIHVVDIARKDALNGEQVRRLCEASNVAIKRYLTFELKDPQATFPVVDWRKVMDSLGLPQTPFGYVDPEDDTALKAASFDVIEDITKAAGLNDIMQKHASAESSAAERRDLVHQLDVLKRAKAQLQAKECELGCEADKALGSIWGVLRNDAIKTGSINEAYTIALDKVGMRYQMPDAIDELFNKLHRSISQTVTSKLAALDVTPVIGAINPEWDLVHNLTVYMASNKGRHKVAQMIQSADRKIDETLATLFGGSNE